MKYCGLDLGKKSSDFVIMNSNRRVLKRGKLKTTRRGLEKAFRVEERMRIVLEATGNSFWIADLLESFGHEVIVVDPGRTKAIGAARIKHDRLDATILAELGCADLLAKVDRPSREMRLRRVPLTARDTLVRSRTRLLNSVRGTLNSEGLDLPKCSAPRFVELVMSLESEIDEGLFCAVKPLLDTLEAMGESIAELDAQIEASVDDEGVIALLQTLPGVGPKTALAFYATIRDPKRFARGRQVAAYLGLVPSLYQSGKTRRLGRITKCGNATLRWLLTMAANSVMRQGARSRLGAWGNALAARVGRKKAVVALARKLSTILLAMWKAGLPFDDRLGPPAAAR